MIKARIVSTSAYLPENRVTNFDLEKKVDTSAEWIVERTGIHERRIGYKHEASSDLAFEAAKTAIKRAGLKASDIDTIVCSTVSGDFPFPSTASIVQGRLEAKNAAAFDLGAACSGFIYGLFVAESLIKSGAGKKVLLIGVDMLSKVTDWDDRSTCILFGDGCGAVILEPTEEDSGILSTEVRSDGTLWDFLQVPGGGSRHPCSQECVEKKLPFARMKGNETYKVAVKSLESISVEILEKNGIKTSQIALMIPHQANLRIIQAVAKRLALPMDKVMINIDKYGNTSAASIPIALDEAVNAGRIRKGDYILLAAFGSGLTWGASLIKW
jgi:3-oxoacyl-[acyl-carrier-protein] synthase III